MSLKKRVFSSLFVLSLMSSCSTYMGTSRIPSSLKSNPLGVLLQEIEVAVYEGVNSTKSCHQKIDHFYAKLFNLNAKNIEMAKLTPQQMDEFVESSFLIRLEIKNKLKTLELGSVDSHRCLSSVKRIVRALRYVEDYFVEFSYMKQGLIDKTHSYTNLKGTGTHFLTNPNFQFSSYEDLQGGDVILSRGNAYSSAAIARIGDDDMQFSHLSLVHQNEKDGSLHTTEAHIEIGNVVAPIKVHIDQGNARTVVFRMNDENISYLAGKKMYDYVAEHKKRTGKNIPYDFSMDYSDPSKIFCSEVIYMGYEMAAKDLKMSSPNVPMYKTKFNKGLLSFLTSIGLNLNEDNIGDFDTFGPGDIQFDPRFDVVAEWRNPMKMRDSRFKDAILTKIFQWMENEDYIFHPTFGTKASNDFAWLMRRTGWTRTVMKKLTGMDLEEKFPLNMNSAQIDLFVVLDQVGEKLYSRIEQEQKKVDYPLSFFTIFKILDEYKANDEKLYKKYKEDIAYNAKMRRQEYDHSSFETAQARLERGPRPYKRRKLVSPDFHLLFHK